MDIVLSAVTIVGIMICVAFVVSIAIGRNDIADVLWGAYPASVAGYFWWTSGATSVQMIVYGLVMLWGVRLMWHIGSRNQKKTEDPRYAQWRTDWQKKSLAWFYLRSFLQIYVLQGILSLLVMTPVLIMAHYGYDAHWNVFIFAGLVIWSLGFFFEAVGDYQLRRFIADQKNRGQIMMEGLWKYTRHPNYFGEVTMWWGLFVIVSTHGCVYGIISPVVVTILILVVSGIPMTERRYRGNVEFEKYKKKTNAFFPGPVKR